MRSSFGQSTCVELHENLGTKRQEEERSTFELKARIIGRDDTERKEGTYQSCTGMWKEWRLELEGNGKHVQELLRCTRMKTCSPVNSPTIAEDFKDDDRKKTRGSAECFATRHRKARGTALAVYMS